MCHQHTWSTVIVIINTLLLSIINKCYKSSSYKERWTRAISVRQTLGEVEKEIPVSLSLPFLSREVYNELNKRNGMKLICSSSRGDVEH